MPGATALARSHSLPSSSWIKMRFAAPCLVLLFLSVASGNSTVSSGGRGSETSGNAVTKGMLPANDESDVVPAETRMEKDGNDLDPEVTMDELLLFESLIDDSKDIFDGNSEAEAEGDKADNTQTDATLGTATNPVEAPPTLDKTGIRRQGELNPEFPQQKLNPSVQFDDSKQEITKEPPLRFGQRSRPSNNRVQDEAPLLQLIQGGYQRPYQRPARFRNRQMSRPESSEQSENVQEPDRSSNYNRPLNARRIVPQVAYSASPQSPYALRPGPAMRSAFDLPPRNGAPMSPIMPTAVQNGFLSTPQSVFNDYTTTAFQTQFPPNNDIALANFARTTNNIPLFQSSQRNPFQDPRLFYQGIPPQLQTQSIMFDPPARNMQQQVPSNNFYPHFENSDDGSRSNFASYFNSPAMNPQFQVPPNFYGANVNEGATAFNNPPISFLSNYPNPDERFSSHFLRHPVATDVQNQRSIVDQQPDSDASQEGKNSKELESKEESSSSNHNDDPSDAFGQRLQNEGEVYIRYPTNEAGYAIEENLPPENNSAKVQENAQPSLQEQRNFANSDPYRNALNTIRNQRRNHTYRFVPEELFRDVPVDFGYQRTQGPIFVEYPDRNRNTPRYPVPNFDSRSPLNQITSLPENTYPFLNVVNQQRGIPITDAAPSCAKENNASVCFEDSEYPRNDILYAINSNSFLMDRMSSPDLMALVNSKVNISGTQQVQENYACAADTTYGSPTRAKNLAGSWRVIVNLQGRFEQPTRMEVCRSVGDPCRYADSKTKTTCVQKYNLQRLLSWSPDRGIFSDVFKIPVACSCQILEGTED